MLIQAYRLRVRPKNLSLTPCQYSEVILSGPLSFKY